MDKIITQFKRIERNQLAAEFSGKKGQLLSSAADDEKPVRRGSKKLEHMNTEVLKGKKPVVRSDTSLSLEERVHLAMMDDKTRRSFLERELRARRYHLLPQIHDWEDEMRGFWIKMQEWRETKKAVAVMTHGNDHEALQRVGPMPWPPARPVCVPKEEELQEIVQRARKNPDNVTQIVQHKSRGASRGRRMSRRGQQGAEDDDEKMVSDHELRACWGIDLDGMPGLNPGNLHLAVRRH